MKNLKRILILLIALCTIACLCACGGTSEPADDGNKESEQNDLPDTSDDSESESDTVENLPVFSVKVVDAEGTPVKGVMIQICKEVCVPAMSGDDGIAVFNNMEITDGHKLSVLSMPEGYEYTGEAEVYLESGITEYTVTINEVE